jgi:three-Cys-motif partner protein
VWSAEQHTLAKHKILIEYLDAWMPILSRQSQKVGGPGEVIRYIDGFAGPGSYDRGEKGSPVLALEAALNHSRDFPVPIELTFVEADKDRCDTLRATLSPYMPKVQGSTKVRLVPPVCGDCRHVIGGMLDECDRRRTKFGPALVFLDQFGYSSVPMDLIGRILKHAQCEVLSYLFFRDLDRFITDPNKHAAITAAFGGDEWRSAVTMGSGREKFMLATYLESLKKRGNCKYVWPFAMLDANERLLYWLFFCTNNIRGLEEMKKAMWKVDQTGGFTFNDRDGFAQFKFLTTYTDERLAADLAQALNGQTMTVGAINEWVLTQTPAYKFRTALADMERKKLARVPNPPAGRRAGTFSDDSMCITFEAQMSLGF